MNTHKRALALMALAELNESWDRTPDKVCGVSLGGWFVLEHCACLSIFFRSLSFLPLFLLFTCALHFVLWFSFFFQFN
jgi:hypothetical protein